MSILEWLGLAGTPDESADLPETASQQTETVREIVEALDDLAPEQARFIASFAYILGRVAHADLDISDEETREIERAVMEHAGLPEEQVLSVVQMAKTHNQLFGGTENFLVTREFDQNVTHEQKLALLDCLFAVSASDESISSAEEVEIRKIVDELHLTHQDFISARSRYREHLEVLKQRERE
jgi:uncharacterized tellurite resistance protein B-like protein